MILFSEPTKIGSVKTESVNRPLGLLAEAVGKFLDIAM